MKILKPFLFILTLFSLSYTVSAMELGMSSPGSYEATVEPNGEEILVIKPAANKTNSIKVSGIASFKISRIESAGNRIFITKTDDNSLVVIEFDSTSDSAQVIMRIKENSGHKQIFEITTDSKEILPTATPAETKQEREKSGWELLGEGAVIIGRDIGNMVKDGADRVADVAKVVADDVAQKGRDEANFISGRAKEGVLFSAGGIKFGWK